MTKKNLELERHNIYLSRLVWGELKLFAFLKERTASEVVNDVVKVFLKQQQQGIQTPGHRSHDPDERRSGRTVYFEPELWQDLQELARSEEFSISALIEELLIDKLDLAEDEGMDEDPESMDSSRFVRVGDDTYVLDANPKIIDINAGQPAQKTPSKGS